MAFVLPNFNLEATQWGNYDAAVTEYASPYLGDIPCNLTPGKRVTMQIGQRINIIDGLTVYVFPMELLIPTLTKVWLDSNAQGPCIWEVPQGSGEMYLCTYADHVGAGFANEHTFLILHRLAVDLVFADVTISTEYPWF